MICWYPGLTHAWMYSFITKATDGSFLGPFGIFMHDPCPNHAVGRAFFAMMLALSHQQGLSAQTREVAILAVGAHYNAKYEIYAHGNVARKVGLKQSQIDLMCRREKPKDLDSQGSVAYDVAVDLVSKSGGGKLSDSLYQKAVESLGQEGTMALVQFVGFYAYTCIVLNGFDVGVPDVGAS